jgi:uncharacterized protein
VTLAALEERVGQLPAMVVAFSGGVDSALLAYVGHRVLGPRSLAATAVSPSLGVEELEGARGFARRHGLRWVTVDTDELAREGYVRNGPDRCYHCKAELMERLAPLAHAEGAVIALGVNTDDLSDHRPGQRAAAERGAVLPLVDAGLSKADVRAAARRLGLEVWDKPAAACLASRLPHGTPVTLGTLGQVDAAEAGLRALGFRQLRVRHYGDLARVELPLDQLPTALERRAAVVAAVRAAGYRFVTVDWEGFRSGSLNPPAGPRPP